MRLLTRWLGLATALVLLVGCDKVDREQAAFCQSLIFAFESDAAKADVQEVTADPDVPARLVAPYRIDERESWVACSFAGSGMDRDRLLLTAVETPAEGVLTGTRLHMLRVWLGLRPLTVRDTPKAGDDAFGRHVAYATQQTINALSSGAIYALLAVGFTMIYAVLGKLFLAFGQIMMTGSFGAIIAGSVLAGTGAPEAAVLIAALLGAIALGAVASLASGRVLAPVLHAPNSQAALIASIGLALALQEAVRLAQGAREIWLQPPFPQRYQMFVAGDFDVSIGAATLVVIAMACAMFLFIAAALRTRFGRAYRACADDAGMAALVGVQVPAVTVFVMFLGGISAGIAGAIIALLYGGVSFYTGTLIGLKALTAAIVGGIGSVRGAALGAALIAVIETASVGYLSPAYKDVSVFAVLVGVLIWRPQGIAGRPRGRGD